MPEPEEFKPRPEILCHPNIPKPLHGIAPRVIAGRTWWDAQRTAAIAKCRHRCMACQAHVTNLKGNTKWLEGHEMYRFDYKKGRIFYEETVMLCPWCHKFIHSGLLEVFLGRGTIDRKTYDGIIAHGLELLKSAGLLEKWENRHSHECSVAWKDWRLVFLGREWGPSTTCFEDWNAGLWKDWRPPAGTVHEV